MAGTFNLTKWGMDLPWWGWGLCVGLGPLWGWSCKSLSQSRAHVRDNQHGTALDRWSTATSPLTPTDDVAEELHRPFVIHFQVFWWIFGDQIYFSIPCRSSTIYNTHSSATGIKIFHSHRLSLNKEILKLNSLKYQCSVLLPRYRYKSL